MKALVYVGTQEIVYRDEPTPEAPKPGELLLKIDACGLCGSDMHAYHGLDARRVPPLILGHEATGVIQNGPRTGERVIVNPLITCGSCFDCISGRGNLCVSRELVGMRLAGAFAEQIVVPGKKCPHNADRYEHYTGKPDRTRRGEPALRTDGREGAQSSDFRGSCAGARCWRYRGACCPGFAKQRL